MITKDLVIQTVADFIAKNSDCYLIDVLISDDNRIVVEIDSFYGISIEICEKLNRFIEQNINRDTEDYELEVSSAGLTSPFKVQKQYQKNLGKDVEVLTKTGEKLTGILTQINENNFTVSVEKKIKPEGAKRKTTVTEDITFSFEEIESTKYCLKI